MNNLIKGIIIVSVASSIIAPVVVLVMKEKGTIHTTTSSKWTRAFEADPAIVGRWNTVDYVRSMDDFRPGHKNFMDEFFIKDLTFHDDGTASKFIDWSKGYIWYIGDSVEGKYTIRTIDGKDYLFMEWINGDVILRGRKPAYYVFEKEPIKQP